MRTIARIVARNDGRGGTCLPVPEGEGPLAPRHTRGSGAEARGVLVGAMSGPLGGDRFTVEARAGSAAAGRVGRRHRRAAGTAPGRGPVRRRDRRGRRGRTALAAGAVDPARNSGLRVATRVQLAPAARPVLREERVLGRAGERPGRLAGRLAVRVAGRTVLERELCCATGAPGGRDGHAVPAGHRAVGQLVVVRPEFARVPVAARVPGEGAVLMPLVGPAVLVSAVAPDALRLRRPLDAATAALGPATPPRPAPVLR